MTSRLTREVISPRGLSREVAALYCGLSKEGFDEWVRRGLVPGPIPGTQRWDRKAIDLALDRASGICNDCDDQSPFAAWERTRARQNSGR